VVNDSPTFTEAERHVHRIIAEWTGLLPRHIAARTGRASTEVSTTLDALQAGGHIHKGADGLWRAKP
jgi:DNA-binding MarR family transcriptional regulator